MMTFMTLHDHTLEINVKDFRLYLHPHAGRFLDSSKADAWRTPWNEEHLRIKAAVEQNCSCNHLSTYLM